MSKILVSSFVWYSARSSSSCVFFIFSPSVAGAPAS
jgi:hypothetical protein